MQQQITFFVIRIESFDFRSCDIIQLSFIILEFLYPVPKTF